MCSPPPKKKRKKRKDRGSWTVFDNTYEDHALEGKGGGGVCVCGKGHEDPVSISYWWGKKPDSEAILCQDMESHAAKHGRRFHLQICATFHLFLLQIIIVAHVGHIILFPRVDAFIFYLSFIYICRRKKMKNR